MIRRLRKLILITGTLLSLLIAVAFVVSAWWWMYVGFPGYVIGIDEGALRFYTSVAYIEWRAGCQPHAGGLDRALVGSSWGTGVILPLIHPFAAIAVATLLVWRFWPRPPKPGHCRCGYDLTGNRSGVCPECGAEVRA